MWYTGASPEQRDGDFTEPSIVRKRLLIALGNMSHKIQHKLLIYSAELGHHVLYFAQKNSYYSRFKAGKSTIIITGYCQ